MVIKLTTPELQYENWSIRLWMPFIQKYSYSLKLIVSHVSIPSNAKTLLMILHSICITSRQDLSSIFKNFYFSKFLEIVLEWKYVYRNGTVTRTDVTTTGKSYLVNKRWNEWKIIVPIETFSKGILTYLTHAISTHIFKQFLSVWCHTKYFISKNLFPFFVEWDKIYVTIHSFWIL